MFFSPSISSNLQSTEQCDTIERSMCVLQMSKVALKPYHSNLLIYTPMSVVVIAFALAIPAVVVEMEATLIEMQKTNWFLILQLNTFNSRKSKTLSSFCRITSQRQRQRQRKSWGIFIRYSLDSSTFSKQ